MRCFVKAAQGFNEKTVDTVVTAQIQISLQGDWCVQMIGYWEAVIAGKLVFLLWGLKHILIRVLDLYKTKKIIYSVILYSVCEQRVRKLQVCTNTEMAVRAVEKKIPPSFTWVYLF